MHQFTGESLPLTELRHPALRSAYEYWCLKKGSRTFPSRKDISPEEMKPYLANVMLIDVLYEPFDFIFRVYGSEIARATGKDHTGKSVHSLEPPEFATLIFEHYREAVEERKPRLHGIIFELHKKYHRVTLPLSSDGLRIDKLLAVSIEDRKFWETTGDAKVADANRTGTTG